jgi:hypothetical protein
MNIMADMFDINFIYVADGNVRSEKIVQSNGFLQGGPKSPKDFILFTWDMKHCTIIVTELVIIIIFADDVVMLSRSLPHLQNSLNRLCDYSHKNKLENKRG